MGWSVESMASVLILGGTRFFGRMAAVKIAEDGTQVVLCSRGNIEPPRSNNIVHYIGDANDPIFIMQILQKHNFRCVINQIAMNGKDVQRTLALFNQIPLYILTSSQAVYEFKSNLVESDYISKDYDLQLTDINSYSEGKKSAESILLKLRVAKSAILRFPIVVGRNDYTKRIDFYFNKIRKSEEITSYNPENKLSLITEEDASDCIVSILRQNRHGIFNVKSGDIKFKDLMDLIAGKLGKAVEVKFSKYKESYDFERMFNISPYSFPSSWTLNDDKYREEVNEEADKGLNVYLNELISHILLQN